MAHTMLKLTLCFVSIIFQCAQTALMMKDKRDCPAGFMYLSAVNGGCYKVVTTNLNWNDASQYCESLHKDAHLLVIDDAAEQWIVAEKMKSMQDDTELKQCFRHSLHGLLYWTAGQRVDLSKESPFIWRMKSSNPYEESLNVMDYTNWVAGQPDYYNDEEACMHLRSGHGKTWNDISCISFEMCAICELEI